MKKFKTSKFFKKKKNFKIFNSFEKFKFSKKKKKINQSKFSTPWEKKFKTSTFFKKKKIKIFNSMKKFKISKIFKKKRRRKFSKKALGLGALGKYFQFISMNKSIANWNDHFAGIEQGLIWQSASTSSQSYSHSKDRFFNPKKKKKNHHE